MANDDAPERTAGRVLRACIIVGALLILILAAIPTGIITETPAIRDAAAQSLVSQLAQACKSYELNHDRYPPGDGSGSSTLRACLHEPGPKKLPYFEFAPEAIDARGNIVSPVGEGKIILYRCPGLHNPKSFDLWCEDRKGRSDGINNWEK